MDFVIATEKVNRYGYRLLMDGVQLDNFISNPIMLYMHSRSGDKYPVGRWENLRIENNQLVGEPVFDVDDEKGAVIKRKVDNKFINAVSVGFDPISVSENTEHLLKGQTRPTITEWELLEVSFVDIPGDPNAVRLNLKEGESIDDILPEIKSKNKMEINKMPALVLNALALSDGATEQDAVKAIEKLKAGRVNALLSFGEQKGVVTEDNKPTYEKLAQSDFATTLELIGNTDSPDGTGEGEGGGPDDAGEGLVQQLLKAAASGKGGDRTDKNDRSNWTFDDYQRKDPKALNQLRLNDSEAYEALAQAYAKE